MSERKKEEVFVAVRFSSSILLVIEISFLCYFEYDGSNATTSASATATASTSAAQQRMATRYISCKNPEHILPHSSLISQTTWPPTTKDNEKFRYRLHIE
jgi:hypothetical protein